MASVHASTIQPPRFEQGLFDPGELAAAAWPMTPRVVVEK
jgi:hypothetical protein